MPQLSPMSWTLLLTHYTTMGLASMAYTWAYNMPSYPNYMPYNSTSHLCSWTWH